MKILNPSGSENCRRRNGVIALAHTVNIKVSHALNRYEAALPSTSTFGYLKCLIAQAIGLKPEKLKLLFRGIEREEHEDLQTAGIMHNSEVLVAEWPEESKGEAAVAQVRKEVDKLEQQVLALKGGTRVDDKEIVYLTEMLMRQLLKLDDIDAEGKGKVERKLEVRRVQSIVDSLDVLKSNNAHGSGCDGENATTSNLNRERLG